MPDTPNIEGIKRLIAPDYPVPEGFRCFSIIVPDDTKHLAILAAFYALIGQNWAWTGTADERQTRSQIWREAYALTEWIECMDCEDVADCIDNDELVQEALRQNLINNINTDIDVQTALQNVYNQWIGGSPMPPEFSGQDLLPDNPACDYDVLFGSVFYAIDEMNEANIDAFESAELIGNALERANLLMSAVPVFETLPVDEVIEYAETLWTDDLFEAYLANDTSEYRDELKCDLFCIARQRGCTLSIDDMFSYFVERIGADPLNDLVQLLAYLVTGVWTGTQVNDMFFASQLILMKLGNQYFSLVGLRNYRTLLAIGARMPDSTWNLICEECPTALAFNMGMFSKCGSVEEIIPFVAGVPFDVTGYVLEEFTTSWCILLKLPDGLWNVTLNSIDGVITPPADENETAYAWHDTSGAFHNVLWNAPATPADFGNKDTSEGIYTIWCSTAEWHIGLFNSAPFTASITVTAI